MSPENAKTESIERNRTNLPPGSDGGVREGDLSPEELHEMAGRVGVAAVERALQAAFATRSETVLGAAN
jgi:hypothetical protein